MHLPTPSSRLPLFLPLPLRRLAPRLARTAAVAAVVSFALPRPVAAQMPGLPVLQNVFPNRGVTAGINFGSTPESRTYGIAGAFATIGSRFAASLGLGLIDPAGAGLSSRSSAGLRIAVTGPRFFDRSVGVAAFAGFGGAPRKSPQPGISNVPVGLAVGWRHAVGERRGIAVYAAPFYSWSRSSLAGESASRGLFRVSAGLDFAVTQRIGLTVGGEGGAKAGAGEPGPTSSSFGAGLAYAFR